jgi:enterochelin esterase-like enzyme
VSGPVAGREVADRAVGRRTALRLGGAAVLGALGTAGSLFALGQAETVPGLLPTPNEFWTEHDPWVPDRSPRRSRGPVEWISLYSAFRPGPLTRILVMAPPGGDPAAPGGLPVCLVLHGRGARAHDAFLLRMPGFLADAVADGVPPFALVAVDAGSSYYHPRADGSDTFRMLTDDVLPLLARRGWGTGPDRRFAVLGWSMGGYGALLFAQTLGPDRLAAAVASSPSLWTTFRAAPEGVFDSQDDYDRYDVYAGRDRMHDVAVRVDTALGDQYLPAVRQFLDGCDPRPAGGFAPGAHNRRFWRRRLPGQLGFVGEHLRDGRR